MGRPPSNGGPAFRFMTNEVTEMESILQEHNNAMPIRDVLVALADKFTESTERKGKTIVQMKQVWNWFQNRRYAIRAKSSKTPVKLNVSPMHREESTPMRTVPQLVAAPMNAPVPTTMAIPSVPNVARAATENSYMEFEAKSSRDGAWYDVGTFLSHRHLDTGDPEALVRFAGFGPDEDEWINIRKHVRQRSLPCEASECVAVLPGDLILCFQEGKDQALYYDAHVLDAQRRRHDVRGCRCRFLVRYDHDQSEEIVALRKVCRRPETDYRLHQLQSANDLANTDQKKATTDPTKASIQRISVSSAETVHKQPDLRLGALALSRANISVPAKIPMPVPKEAETSSTINVGNPSIQSISTVNVGNPSIQASSTVNVGNPSIQAAHPSIQAAHPSIQASSTVNVGNPSIQASSTVNIGNPSNHTSSTVNVGNPSNHTSSTVNVGNPSNHTSSTVNVGNPSNHTSSTVNVGNPSNHASSTVNVGNPSNHASSTVNVGNHSIHASSTMTTESSIAAPNSAPGPGGSVENVQGGK